MHNVREIIVLADLGQLQCADVQIIPVHALRLHNGSTGGLQYRVHIVGTHICNAIHIDFHVHQKAPEAVETVTETAEAVTEAAEEAAETAADAVEEAEETAAEVTEEVKAAAEEAIATRRRRGRKTE